MAYELAKSAHIVAAFLWFAGMVVVALLHTSASGATSSLLTWDRYVTTPAMIATWALGLTMATTAGWFFDGWLMAKLVFVLALSAIHGVLSGRLRRSADKGDGLSRNAMRLVLSALIASLCVIVLLVVAKPF